MFLTKQQVIGRWVGLPTPIQENNIEHLVSVVNGLMEVMLAEGVKFHINPKTGTIISGDTLGGFRPASCSIGAPNSAHKQGMAVDLYDPMGRIDAWLLAHEHMLTGFNLWFEHPDATQNWSHWSIRQPKSGNRFFYP